MTNTYDAEAEIARLQDVLMSERAARASRGVAVPLGWFFLLVLFAGLGVLFIVLEGLAFVL